MKLPILLIVYLIPSSSTSGDEVGETKPFRCYGSPFPKKSPPRPQRFPPRPHSSRDEQQPLFPYKILYLIDDGIVREDYDKLKMATAFVNERFSKFIKARKLDDVRIRNFDPNCEELCEQMPFPQGFVLDCPPTSIPEPSVEIQNMNDANYTLVVRVLAHNQGAIANTHIEDGCVEHAVAFADTCYHPDEDIDRVPHHGFFIFCDKPSSISDEDMRILVMHETLHILMPHSLSGVGANNYDCRDNEGNIANEDCKDKSWKEIKIQAKNAQEHPVEITAGMAIGPFIQHAARDHFGCDTVEGAELNFNIINKSVMEIKIDHAHWSQHLFPDEILAPHYGAGRLSRLTLSALATHTAWYRVDESQAEPLAYSKPAAEFACDVAHKTCFDILREQMGGGGVKFIRPYCDHRQGVGRVIASHCSVDQQRQLSCVHRRSNSRCPFLAGTNSVYDNEVCADATSAKNGTLATHVGASFGPGTICATITNFPPWEADYTGAVCVHHECHSDSLILQFKPNTTDDPNCHITCAKNQSNLLLTVNWCGSSLRVTIICPDHDRVCKETSSASSSTESVKPTTGSTIASTLPTTTTITGTTISASTSAIPSTVVTTLRSTMHNISSTFPTSSSQEAQVQHSNSEVCMAKSWSTGVSIGIQIFQAIMILDY